MFTSIETFPYSVYMRTSGEKECISDEVERVQSVAYSQIKSLSGLYTVVCLREGKRGTCLASPLFRDPHQGISRVNIPHFW